MPCEHLLDHVADAQRLARGVGERQRRRGSAAGSRWRGSARLPAAVLSPAASRSTSARDAAGEEDEEHRERDVEQQVEQHHLAPRVGVEAASMPGAMADGQGDSATITQPTTLKTRLPSGTRRASAPARSVDEHARAGRCRGWRRAPGRAPRAAAARCEAASVAEQQHDREARAADDRQHRADQHVEQHVAGERGEDHLDAGGLHERAWWPRRSSCSARMMRPRPMSTRPMLAGARSLAATGTTPRRRRSAAARATTGRARTPATISAVPTSAPSITASAGRSAIRPWPTNEADDQRRGGGALHEAGDAEAGRRTPSQRLAQLRRRIRRRFAPYDAQDAGAHDVRAPDEQGDAASRLSRCHAILCVRRSPGQRVGLQVGEALHRFLHAFLVAEPRILDAAERRQLQR